MQTVTGNPVTLTVVLTVSSDIVFTSGGTESNNMIIRSAVAAAKAAGVEGKPHVVTSCLEHDSVAFVLNRMQQDGLIDLTVVPTDRGVVTVESVVASLKQTTCLVTIMLANNETGIVQPIEEICHAVKEASSGKCLVHTDAAQVSIARAWLLTLTCSGTWKNSS